MCYIQIQILWYQNIKFLRLSSGAKPQTLYHVSKASTSHTYRTINSSLPPSYLLETSIATETTPNGILPFTLLGNRGGVMSRDIITVVSVLSRSSVPMDGDVFVLALVNGSRILYFNISPVCGFSKSNEDIIKYFFYHNFILPFFIWQM